MLTELHQRVFLLYFAGEPQSAIAEQLNLATTQINYILDNHGQEWVSTFLKQEYREKLAALSLQGLNGQQISDQMGPPWNRWLVLWTMRRIQSLHKIERHNKNSANLNLQKLNFRCPICSISFESNLSEITNNPDRICLNCTDRRKGDRRTSRRY